MSPSRSHKDLPFFLLGLLAVPLPYLSLLLDSSRSLMLRDLTNLEIPLKAEWVRALVQLGRIPHWNPFHVSGFPFLSDPNFAPLYPLNFLLVPFGAENMARGLLWFIVLHHLLIYCGGFLLAKDFRVRAPLAVAAGLGFTWCGYVMSCDVFVNMLCAITAMPFLWLFCRRAAREGVLSPSLILASLALAWPIYGGDPQFSYLGAVSAAWLLRPRRVGDRRAAIARICVLGVCSFLASLPQLAPVAMHLAESERMASQGLGRLAWSLHPWRALECWFPLAFGPTPDPRHYFASPLLNGGKTTLPFIFSFYSGATLAGASLLILFSRRAKKRLYTFLPGAYFLAVLLLSMGKFSPLPAYSLMAKLVPFWGNFRYPERLTFWISAPLIYLGILSLEKLCRLRSRVSPFLPTIIFALLSTTLATILHRLEAPLAPLLIGITFFAVPVLLFFSRTVPRKALPYAIAALVVSDFFAAARQLVWPQPIALAKAESLPLIRKLLADEGGRSEAQARRMVSLKVPHTIDLFSLGATSTLSAEVAEGWGFLRYNTPGFFNLESAQGHSPLLPEKATSQLEGPHQSRELDLRSVRYIVGVEGAPLKINDSALPYAFIPEKVESLSPAEVESRKYDADWNPQETALIEGTSGSSGWKISTVKKNWDEIEISLKPAKTGVGWLVVNENFSPYWTATSPTEGRLDVTRANGWSLAVELPKEAKSTKLTLILKYRENAFYLGLLGPSIWLMVLALSLAAKGRRLATAKSL